MKTTKSDIILILPPNNFTDMIQYNGEYTNKGYYVHYPPLGLCYLAAVLKKEGFNVTIIDALAERLNIDEIIKIVNKMNCKIIGISTTTPTLPVVYQLIKKIRIITNAYIVVGGPHISTEPDTLYFLDADYAIRGEGEYNFLQLCKRLMNNDTKGLERILPVSIISNLDELPYPARELLNNKKYNNPTCALSTTSLITTRGCHYNCVFCSRAVRGSYYNERSIDNVVDEIKEIINKFGIQYITMMDEIFTYDNVRTMTLCEKIIDNQLKFQWACQTRANLVNKELLKEMKKAGCVNLSFGVETGSARIRERIGKPAQEADYLNLIKLCKEVGITTNAYYMFGHEDETEEDMLKTIEVAKKFDTDYASFNLTNIFPGSIIYDKLKNNGKLSNNIWIEYMEGKSELPVYIPSGLNKKIMKNMISKAYRAFYIRPKIIIKHLLRINNINDLLHHLRIFITLIKDYMKGYQ